MLHLENNRNELLEELVRKMNDKWLDFAIRIQSITQATLTRNSTL